MYAHAYQSYVWNLVSAERAKRSCTEPLAGDLVYAEVDADDDDEDDGLYHYPLSTTADIPDDAVKGQAGHQRKVKQLTAEDLPNYTIFNVVMPLPGWGVQYPGGEVGELYEKILTTDGLDPKNMKRDQRSVPL